MTSLIIDSEHKTAPKDPEGPHPLIRTTDLGRARADFKGAQRVSAATHERWTRRATPTEGDLILAREAPVGGVCSVPARVNPVLGQRTVLVRPDPAAVDGKFLMYRIAASDLQARLVEMSTGSTVAHLNMADIRQLAIPDVPALRTQRRIAAVLSAFDELIEVKERRIELLEDLAHSLYHDWFVRFRFPGHEDVELVDSKLGPIPEGWEVRRLREVADLRRQGVIPSRNPDGTFEHFSIPAYDAHALPEYHLGSSIKSGKHAVEGESVLLSKINPRLCRVWFVTPSSRLSVASTEFLVWVGTRASNAWLWSMFTGDSFREWLVGIAGGTSTSHQRVNPGDLIDRRVAVAPVDVLKAFDEVAIPGLHEAHTLRRQNRQLAATRDLLLPRLVTGRLDISDLDLDDLLPAEAA